MPEAVKAIIEYCFSVLQLDYLTCGHFDHNNRSKRVIENCGFHFFKNTIYTTACSSEHCKMYVLYRSEFEQQI